MKKQIHLSDEVIDAIADHAAEIARYNVQSTLTQDQPSRGMIEGAAVNIGLTLLRSLGLNTKTNDELEKR